MNEKFTPGPWFVDADFYVYGGDGRKNQGEYFDGVEFPLVCDAESDSRDRTENKANAALIAAAPEMYEALKKLKECLENFFGKTEKDFFEDCDNGELYFAREYNYACNVLKKARGDE